MPAVSRRNFLQNSAVAAATVVPVAVVGCISNPAPAAAADAELIQLGAEFERLYASWPPFWRECWRMHDVWDAELKTRGMSFAEHGHDACMAVSEEIGATRASDANDQVVDRLDALAGQIRSIAPKGLAGIAVWAKVARFECVTQTTLAKPPEDRDWADKCLLGFFAEIERLASSQAVAS